MSYKRKEYEWYLLTYHEPHEIYEMRVYKTRSGAAREMNRRWIANKRSRKMAPYCLVEFDKDMLCHRIVCEKELKGRDWLGFFGEMGIEFVVHKKVDCELLQ